MRIYVLLGPPGAGKGTVAPIIAKNARLLHVSTGQLIREMMRDPTSDLGQRCMPFMDRGDYVPDEIMLEIIGSVLDGVGGDDILLDGFPRSVQQAKDLNNLLAALKGRVCVVLLLEVDEKVAIERCGKRRTCTSCGSVFHIVLRLPKVDGVCDVCEASLELRGDDSPSMVKRRLKHFRGSASDIVTYYEEMDVLQRIDAGVPVDEVVRQVTDYVELDER